MSRVKLIEGQVLGQGQTKQNLLKWINPLTGGLSIKNSARVLGLSGVWMPSRILYRSDLQKFSVTVASSLVCLCNDNRIEAAWWENPEKHSGFKRTAPQGGAAALRWCPGPRPTPSASPARRHPAAALGGFGAATTPCGGPASLT